MTNKTMEVISSEDYSDKMLPNTIIHLTEGAFGVFGNTIVLIMYTMYIVDKNMTRFFIPILALVDLIGCLSNVVQFHLQNTMQYVYPDVYLCKSLFFLMIMSGGFSASLIFAIALQRFLMICRPFDQQMTRKYCKIATVIFGLFSIVYAAPLLKFAGLIKGLNVSNCHLDDSSHGSGVMVPYFGSLLLLSFINIIATICLYIPVAKTIYRKLSPNNDNGDRPKCVLEIDKSASSKDTPSTSVDALKSDRKLKARKRISAMFLVIIIVYVVSYMTSLVTQIHSLADPNKYLTGFRLNIYYICLRLNLLNHIANPYIYLFYDVKFQRELQKLCCKRRPRKPV